MYTIFIRDAEIKPFSPSEVPLPTAEASYNDDVKLPCYQSSARAFAERQRKGIVEEHPETRDISAHITAALSAPFFLSLATPLPPSTTWAMSFVKDCNPAAIQIFWTKQLNRLRGLVRDSAPVEKAWLEATPDAIRPATGKIKLVALASLMNQLDLGGSKWIKQFIHGFRLTGTFSQKSTFPLDPRVTADEQVPLKAIFGSSQQRFWERSAKSGHKNANALWNEAMEQCEKGWLHGMFPLREAMGPGGFKDKAINVAFRFGVAQDDKLRACDDLRHALVNLACKVTTPIKLVSRDHVAELCRSSAGSSYDWSFFKADHQAAYKQLPLDPSETNLAITGLRNPKGNLWYGFYSRTLVFGAVSAVLHYNVFREF